MSASALGSCCARGTLFERPGLTGWKVPVGPQGLLEEFPSVGVEGPAHVCPALPPQPGPKGPFSRRCRGGGAGQPPVFCLEGGHALDMGHEPPSFTEGEPRGRRWRPTSP